VISRQWASVVLLEGGNGDGSYVLRVDQQAIGSNNGTATNAERCNLDAVYLSMLFHGNVRHFPIRNDSGTLYLSTRPFRSLDKLIAHHSKSTDLALPCLLRDPCPVSTLRSVLTCSLHTF
jgi:hypothetical protein